MLYGAFGLGCCMMMASILLSFGKPHTSAAAVAFFFIYMIIFGGSINVVPCKCFFFFSKGCAIEARAFRTAPVFTDPPY